jgi:hypothetical protein
MGADAGAAQAEAILFGGTELAAHRVVPLQDLNARGIAR